MRWVVVSVRRMMGWWACVVDSVGWSGGHFFYGFYGTFLIVSVVGWMDGWMLREGGCCGWGRAEVERESPTS